MPAEVKISLIIMGLIFIGAALGGGLVRILFPFLKGKYYYLPLFCGGVLAGMLGFELIPETIASYEALGLVAGGSMGILLMILADKYMHNLKHTRIQKPKIIFILFLALFIHSIPTGIALGINFGESDTSLLNVVLVHHVPEGMVLMASLLISKVSVNLFWLLCIMLSALVAVNLYVGMTLNFISPKMTTLFMGAAVSTLSYVTFYEILWKNIRKYLSFTMLFVIISGTLFIRLYLYLVI